jgi:hypothetical protein
MAESVTVPLNQHFGSIVNTADTVSQGSSCKANAAKEYWIAYNDK